MDRYLHLFDHVNLSLQTTNLWEKKLDGNLEFEKVDVIPITKIIKLMVWFNVWLSNYSGTNSD
jgi:hypothetical protein